MEKDVNSNINVHSATNSDMDLTTVRKQLKTQELQAHQITARQIILLTSQGGRSMKKNKESSRKQNLCKITHDKL